MEPFLWDRSSTPYFELVELGFHFGAGGLGVAQILDGVGVRTERALGFLLQAGHPLLESIDRALRPAGRTKKKIIIKKDDPSASFVCSIVCKIPKQIRIQQISTVNIKRRRIKGLKEGT